jgi:hypothetical protein
VEWRFARPDVISVAKKEAVARLDTRVGPEVLIAVPMFPQRPR